MAKKAKMAAKKRPQQSGPLLLDLGCGTVKRPGFVGVDIRKYDAVDVVADLTKKWPWKDNSVDEVICSNLLNYLEPKSRAFFFNELQRVLKPEAKALITTPHWGSSRAFGDPMAVYPPISEDFYRCLDAKWRTEQAPWLNEIFSCDLVVTWGYSLSEWLANRNEEFRNFAITAYREACKEILATVMKKAEPKKE